MTTPTPLTPTTESTSAFPEVDSAAAPTAYLSPGSARGFAMVPGKDGHQFLASGWRISRPIDQWTRSDFYGHSGDLPDEAAFHGGFHLSATRNRMVSSMLRAEGGWYEEDAAWAIVAITFPHLFTTYECRCADRTLRDSWPDAWEAIFGRSLTPGESWTKDRRAFEEKHADDWIVVSAITSEHRKKFVECVATPGGKRGPGTEERRFLVPSDEYEIGRFGFVIDVTRHQVYAGPSSFIGWQRRGSP